MTPASPLLRLAICLCTAMCLVDISHTLAADAPNPINDAKDAQRKRLGDNKYWYGSVVVNIRGSGHRSNSSEDESSFSVQHDAEAKFRMVAIRGELGALTALEEAMKRMPNNPIIASNLEKLRMQRHWISETTNRKPEDEADVKLLVQDRTDISGREPREGGGGQKYSGFTTLEGKDDRKAAIINQLTIDFAKGTYDFVLDPKWDQLELTAMEGGTWKRPPINTTRKDSATQLPMRFMNQKLPPDGNVLTGSLEIPQRSPMGFGSVRGTITWTLSPVPLEDVELVIKPEGYDDWMPRGGKNEETEGNTIRLNAVLQRRGGGKTDAKMKSLVIRMDDVSREPGVCLNFPITNGSPGATSFDMKFAANHNPGVTIDTEGTRILKKDAEFTDLPFVVSSYDWGGWCSVTGQATLTDGRFLFAHLDGDPTSRDVRLPKRDPDSKVADKWKSDMGVSGARDNDDTDKQDGNKNNGDGLTLYEEYRGLIARGKHTRDHSAGPDGVKPLTPKKKDLIIHNTIKNNADVSAGILLFEKASGIHIVEVDDDEMPESRQVNVNAGKITAGPQFGLRLLDEAPISKNAVGETQGLVATRRNEPDPAVSPKGFPKVIVSLAILKSNYNSVAVSLKKQKIPSPGTLRQYIASSVAHEIAHGIGVRHHGPSSYGSTISEVTAKMTSFKIYDRDGSEILDRPFSIQGDVGNTASDASGDVNCIMCYNNTYTWCYVSRFSIFYALPILPEGQIFCTSDKATGPNAEYTLPNGKKMPGIFGPASRGDCLGQMRVRDQ